MPRPQFFIRQRRTFNGRIGKQGGTKWFIAEFAQGLPRATQPRWKDAVGEHHRVFFTVKIDFPQQRPVSLLHSNQGRFVPAGFALSQFNVSYAKSVAPNLDSSGQ